MGRVSQEILAFRSVTGREGEFFFVGRRCFLQRKGDESKHMQLYMVRDSMSKYVPIDVYDIYIYNYIIHLHIYIYTYTRHI